MDDLGKTVVVVAVFVALSPKGKKGRKKMQVTESNQGPLMC